MKRALVTGVRGQDGFYLAEQLVALGFDVHGTTRELEQGSKPAEVTEHVLDLDDGGQITRVIHEVSPHLIFNCAGLSSVGQSWNDPVRTMRVNAVAVVSMLDAASALETPPRFVQSSSAEIFAGSGSGQCDETTPVHPTTPYGASKALAHHMTAVYRSRGLHASSCILFNHESPRRPNHFVTRKITEAAARIAAGDTAPLVLGDVSARRDWGWAPDYTNGMIAAALHDEPGDYVFATGIAHSVEEFTEAAFAAVGISAWRDHVVTDHALFRPNDAPVLVGDASRARQVLSWTPSKTFAEVVQAMVTHDVERRAHHDAAVS
jgi:GDPmannose 4,6-dehydratase